MEACPLTGFKCTPTSRSHSYVEKQQHRKDLIKGASITSDGAQTVCRVPRRLILESMGFNAIMLHVSPAIAAPMLEKESQIGRTVKLPSGVKVQDIVEGNGPEAREGDLVELNYVCRRFNGYFVHSTVDQFSGESTPVKLPLVDNQIIQGLKEVLIGMKVGGKRRASIPPSVGYINENLQPIPEEFGPRRSLLSHVNEPLVFEVTSQNARISSTSKKEEKNNLYILLAH